MLSRTACFRRHNFAGILLDTLGDLATRTEEERTSVMEAMEQVLEGILQRDSGVRIRPQLEQTTEMFGRSLDLVNGLPSGHKELCERFITKFCQICQTILFEDRPTKKVCHHVTLLTVDCQSLLTEFSCSGACIPVKSIKPFRCLRGSGEMCSGGYFLN